MKTSLSIFIAVLLVFGTLPLQAEEFRQSNLSRLSALGFKVAPSLPQSPERSLGELRPQKEIESRFDALHALVIWVAAPPGIVNDQGMQKRALEGDLSPWLTEDEKAIFRKSKVEAKAQHLDNIGWQMENMWSLAWVLGFHAEPALKGQLQGDLARELVFKFSLSGERKLRDASDVRVLEDLFYCAYNAVRSAQNGGKTVPPGFDPKSDGGGIHERRHGLTWCLSPCLLYTSDAADE